MSMLKFKYYFIMFGLFIFIIIIYIIIYMSTGYLVYKSASESLDIYLNKNSMQRRPGEASGEIILQPTVTGATKVKLFSTAWKKENSEEKYRYCFTMERSWFFGDWEILTIEERGKAINWPNTDK